MPRLPRGPYFRTRRPRPSEKTTSASSPGLPPKAILARIAHPSEGRAPHARGDGLRLTGACALSATRRSFGPDYHVVPRLDYGLGIRTRRPRPSEKTTSRAF
jgi:hypothetical protein